MPRDLLLSCSECKTQFVWTIAEQEAGPQPSLCRGCHKLAPGAGRQRGLVKWFSRSRGYGFITPVTGADVFVHKSVLTGETASLRAGQLVEFGLSHAARGVQADAVVVLEIDEGQKTEDEGGRREG